MTKKTLFTIIGVSVACLATVAGVLGYLKCLADKAGDDCDYLDEDFLGEE